MLRTGLFGLCLAASSIGVGIGIGRGLSYAMPRHSEVANAKPAPPKKTFEPKPSLVQGKATDPQPKLEPVKEFAFGEVESPFKGTATWTLKNSGVAPLKIRTDGVSCGCTKPTLAKDEVATIEPGKEYTFAATLDLKGDQPVKRIVQISTSDPQAEQIELVMTATPKPKTEPTKPFSPVANGN